MSTTKKEPEETTYAYREKLIYDPDEKREVPKHVLVGKIDEKTGKVTPVNYEELPPNVPVIINIKTARPEKFVMDITKPGKLAFDQKQNQIFYDKDNVNIALEKKGSKKEINTLLSIKFDIEEFEKKGGPVYITKNLSSFDRIVYDAITTLFVEGQNSFFTTQMVFHVMTGDYSKGLSPTFAEEIEKSITKMAFTSFILNASQEGEIYKGLSNFVYSSYLLPIESVTATLNGTKVTCFHLLKTLPLYDYASRKNQIARVDINLLSLPFKTSTEDKKRESKTSMMIAYYLMRRIIAMKSISNAIVYNTVYEFIGMSDASRVKKFRIRENIKKILESWKETTWGDIKILGFDEKNKRGKPYEIVINYRLIKGNK